MGTVRIHRYTVETGNLATMLERRSDLIEGIRSANPSFVGASLTRLDDGTYLDVWRWDSVEEMHRAARAATEVPLAGATMSLTTDHTVIDGTILDER